MWSHPLVLLYWGYAFHFLNKTKRLFLNNNKNQTFVTTCKEDYDLLCAELYDREKLRVNVHNMEHPLSHFRPSMTRDEIQQLGFESFLLDSIQGPEEILAFLCQRSNVHRIVSILDI